MKQLVPYGTGALIQHAVDIAASIAPAEILAVTGAGAAKVRKAARHASLRWVHNPRWPDGLGSTIAAGAASIHPDTDGLLILLCDQWRLCPQDLQKLAAAWHASPGRIAVAKAGGTLMPPVIFPSPCFERLRALDGGEGARSLFAAYPGMITPVALENARFDLDTPAHLASFERPGL